MEHMNLGSTCLSHPNGDGLLNEDVTTCNQGWCPRLPGDDEREQEVRPESARLRPESARLRPEPLRPLNVGNLREFDVFKDDWALYQEQMDMFFLANAIEDNRKGMKEASNKSRTPHTINIGPKSVECTIISSGMWLLRGAILVIFASIPVQLYPVTSSEHINTTSAPVNSLSSIHIEGPRSESPNVTHSYTEDSTVIDSNTTDVSSNTIDDQLVEATSSTRNKICTLCTVDYNATEINNITTNSSNFTMSNVTSTPEEGFFNVGIIIAITVLVIVIFALIGGLSFFAYRHFAWNRPQTLTDKFSNDESTGYIDDTAFRENSEEMYSLDNDSFLNSLEAMTIQNYWTDHVRHTKL